ncbi:hypothetical protein JCM11251_001778 [Rhodosporidiobolus azoricus]
MSGPSSQVKEGNPAERFDKIRYEDLSPEDEWTRLGKGSFGCVYKGEYLGIAVAIKEVLPSTEYEVEKYLQREITLMQQARHPNIVQYLGLCLAPAPPLPKHLSSPSTPPSPPRILIISEFLPRGNLRQYILDRTLPFPWRLRISFATDIVRALAYLHARNTMHRDLKGENLLVSENERLKACDFGLARVAPGGGKEDEAWRRLTYCGTDGYMSPEILLGLPFTLQTDIFSLGILLLEILSRTLASSHSFVRSPPSYGIDVSEVWAAASPLAPKAFVELALECCDTDPEKRPETKEILKRLREIEVEVLEQDAASALAQADAHSRGRSMRRRASLLAGANVGSISFSGTTKKGSYGVLAAAGAGRGTTRPSAPRLPSFEGQVQMKFGSSFVGTAAVVPALGVSKATGSSFPRASLSAEQAYYDAHSQSLPQHQHGHPRRGANDSEEDEEALLALADVHIDIDQENSPPASLLSESLDLNMDMRPDSAYLARLREESDSQEEGDYSVSVIKPASSSSFLSHSSSPQRPYGVLGSRSGSRLLPGGSLPSLPPSWVAASRQPSEAEMDDGTHTVIATPPRSTEGTPRKAPAKLEEQEGGEKAGSGWTARTSTISVAHAVVEGQVGHGLEGSVSSTVLAVEEDGEGKPTVFVSSLQSPVRVRDGIVPDRVGEADEVDDEEEGEVVEMPHRFSLIKPGLHRLFASLSPSPSHPTSLTSYSAGLGPSTSSNRLSFQLAGNRSGVESGAVDGGSALKAKEKDREGRCGLCEKKFGAWKAYLCCDDCGLTAHIKCSDLIPPTCPAYDLSSLPPPPPPLYSPPLSPVISTTTVTSAPPNKPNRPAPALPLGKVDTNVGSPTGSRAASKERDRPSKLVKKTRPASVGGKGSALSPTVG